jgi:FkbM family methyltransferase
MNADIQEALIQFQKLATGSKLMRWKHKPVMYPATLGHAYLLYPRFGRNWNVQAHTFWGDPITLPLPSGLDIFLTGGKSHDSEIRLINWMIKHLPAHQIAMDIGSHIGFFALLMHFLMNRQGNVYAFEPSHQIYPVLFHNIESISGIQSFQLALSNQISQVDYYEYPIAHSEFNTMHPELLENDARAFDVKPTVRQVETVTLDQWISEHRVLPTVLKIDVEGSEMEVLQGGLNYLREHSPQVLMEFQLVKHKRAPYLKAVEIAQKIGYKAYEILADGRINLIDDLEKWADQLSLESDNILLSKSSG